MRKEKIKKFDRTFIFRMYDAFPVIARVALFIVYFYFGILKVFNLSPASPIALALTEKTIGAEYFPAAFFALAVVECLIGVLFLIPKATRVVIPLLLVHTILVSSPLILVPELAWSRPLVPSLEGQYIIKNILIVALAVGVIGRTHPLRIKE